jgi:hypothetical protein
LELEGVSAFDSALVLRAMIEQLPQIVPLNSKFTLSSDGAICVTKMTAAGVPYPRPQGQ